MGSIVGLMGRKRSGKDTVARVVFADYTRRAFADELKAEVERAHLHTPLPSRKTLRDHLMKTGWEGAKDDPLDGMVIRSLLQDCGMAKREIDSDYWLRPVFNPPLPDLLVITDVRMPSEIEAIRDRGGVLVRVENTSLGHETDPTDAHITEQAWRNTEPDFVLVNPGNIPGLLHEGAILRSLMNKNSACGSV